MKKHLFTLAAVGAMSLVLTVPCYALDNNGAPVKQTEKIQKPPMNNMHAQRRAEFDKRLNLSEAQKEKAKEIRENGEAKMKPLFEAMKAKREEIEAIKLSRVSVQMQQEQIAEVKKDMAELRKKMHEVRMQNMKDFEAILTKDQKKELEKMKQEGRKKFEQKRKNSIHKGHIKGKNGNWGRMYSSPRPDAELPVNPIKYETK